MLGPRRRPCLMRLRLNNPLKAGTRTRLGCVLLEMLQESIKEDLLVGM
jgi:hypothetical protein